ncbi:MULTISPECIES: site-specific integrase [unclassified Variovorax]|uniref:site-specific integrase n=2 Tax=Bacteria TaxID=2 RepID=UPI000F7E9A0C|nr:MULTISPECIES: site-specific integrase [unclassified Variovorax]RSZ45742.1 site-specific integrase [Variovorax sp. 553]RSZ46803.1 site-specific integrase [Variovorax sp. 679]
MSAVEHVVTAVVPEVKPGGVLKWRWPDCPNSMSVYDKYAEVSATLHLSDGTWAIPVRGRQEQFRFAEGEVGLLQRKLIILTQTDAAGATITKFTRSLINRWGIYSNLLEQGPDAVRVVWDAEVLDVDTAKAGKTLLKLVTKARLGSWTPIHHHLVTSLSTRAQSVLLAQRGKLKRREKLIPASTQANIVSTLDDAAITVDLPEEVLEGMSALALMFQHGMRPVQLLAVRLEHVPEPFRDAAGDLVLVVSFHAAKQAAGAEPEELVRIVKPEWVSLVNRLRLAAIAAGRNRLFLSTSADALWKSLKQACKARGHKVNFTANYLRHTSAQSLADAGHARKSIQGFLGHSTINAATTYLRASRQQGELINKALGASKLYENIVAISRGSFISVKQLEEADEDQQIGGIVGARLIAGIGLCRGGQSGCTYNPVTSCYGCRRFLPVAQVQPHEEAIAGMREQVQVYLDDSKAQESPAFMQLTTALSGAQQAIQLAKSIEAESNV